MNNVMEYLKQAGIVYAYEVLTYTKCKDGIDVDYPAAELERLVEAAQASLQEQVDKLHGQLRQCWACEGGSVDGVDCSVCDSCGWVTGEYVQKLEEQVKELEAERNNALEVIKRLAVAAGVKSVEVTGLDGTPFFTYSPPDRES